MAATPPSPGALCPGRRRASALWVYSQIGKSTTRALRARGKTMGDIRRGAASMIRTTTCRSRSNRHVAGRYGDTVGKPPSEGATPAGTCCARIWLTRAACSAPESKSHPSTQAPGSTSMTLLFCPTTLGKKHERPREPRVKPNPAARRTSEAIQCRLRVAAKTSPPSVREPQLMNPN